MEFRILGPLEIAGDDGPLALPGGRAQRALLLYLLLNANEVVSTDRLLDVLWAEGRPATAQKMVQLYVSQLRKTLGDRLVTRPPGYVLELRDGELDADRARSLAAAAGELPAEPALPLLEEALALWRGEPLTDVRYEDFAQPDVARLDELRLSLFEQRFDAELTLGRHAALVPELEGLVARHPLREHLRGQLMTALYRSGRQADALAVYRDGRRRLVDELGLEPGDELRELERMILEHDAALAPPVPLTERVLRRPRLLAAVGALLVAGAIAAAVVELVGGRSHPLDVRPNSVAAIDPASGQVVAVVPVGERPAAIAYGFGAVWVANSDSGTVTRIDAHARRVVATIGDGGDVSDLAIGFGSVWVADGNAGTLTRIDPHANTVRDTIEFGPADPLRPNPIFTVAIGGGSVWVARDPGVLRIDPQTDEVVATIRCAPASGLAVGNGRLWVTTSALERIQRYDLDTGRKTGEVPTTGGVTAPFLAYDALWALVSTDELWQIDQNSLAVFGTVRTAAGAADLAADGGRMWVATNDERGVAAFGVRSLKPGVAVRLPAAPPAAVAAGGGYLWVALNDHP